MCPNLNLIKSYDMLLLKIFFFMHYFGAKIPKKVLTTQKKTSCHVFKMGIFSKLFVAVMAHITMENADQKIKLLLICFQSKIVDMLLSFFLLASLYTKDSYCICPCIYKSRFKKPSKIGSYLIKKISICAYLISYILSKKKL